MISSGKNSPDFNPLKDSLDRLMISLHKKESATDFCRKYQWNEMKYENAVNFLISKNYVREEKGNFIPTCMVITQKEGKGLMKKGKFIAKQIASQIIKIKPEITRLYLTTTLSGNFPFDSISFFIFSDVLLDSWQIRNVENLFLNKPRPERHGKNYYLAYIENVDKSRESFGIYGNQSGKSFRIYGNNRNNINSKSVNDKLKSLPLIDSTDDVILDKMAEVFKDPLMNTLNKNKSYIEKVYKSTNYLKEISFEEFFIWWYHFIYTSATNILSAKKELYLPHEGNFFYRMN